MAALPSPRSPPKCHGPRVISALGDDVASYPGEVDGSVRVAILPAVVDGYSCGAAAFPADPTGSIGTGRPYTSAQLRAPECFNHEHPFRLLFRITLGASFLFRILDFSRRVTAYPPVKRHRRLPNPRTGGVYETVEETTLLR